jgi:cell wall-associated NlpC family hydrolase
MGALLTFGGSATASADPPMQGSSPCIQGSCVTQQEDNAVRWAAAHEGSTDYDGWCLLFVYDAYASAGVDIGHSDSAYSYWQEHPDQQRGGPIPEGALIFYGPTDGNPYGHVAIATGDGRAWSTMERQYYGVHLMSIDERNASKPYLGYILPA